MKEAGKVTITNCTNHRKIEDPTEERGEKIVLVLSLSHLLVF